MPKHKAFYATKCETCGKKFELDEHVYYTYDDLETASDGDVYATHIWLCQECWDEYVSEYICHYIGE